MDWPHDPDGDEGSEGMRKYGMAVIAKKAANHEFPLTKTEFLEAYADDPIRVNHRSVVSVADIFEYVEGDEFEDVLSFHKAIGAAMRTGEFWEYHPQGLDTEKNPA